MRNLSYSLTGCSFWDGKYPFLKVYRTLKTLLYFVYRSLNSLSCQLTTRLIIQVYQTSHFLEVTYSTTFRDSKCYFDCLKMISIISQNWPSYCIFVNRFLVNKITASLNIHWEWRSARGEAKTLKAPWGVPRDRWSFLLHTENKKKSIG